MTSICTLNWKLLSIVSVVLLGGVSFLSWQNRATIHYKMAVFSEGRDILQARQFQLTQASQDIADLKGALPGIENEIEELKIEEVEVSHQNVVARSDLQILESDIAEAKTEWEKSSAIDLQQVSQMLNDIDELRLNIELSQIELVKLEGSKARINVDNKLLTNATLELQKLRENQDSGIITGPFRAPVVSAFNSMSFVVIGAGNEQGVVSHAQLDIQNNGAPVAKLIVTEVGPKLCIADIVPGSLSPGRRIQVGDWVSQSE